MVTSLYAADKADPNYLNGLVSDLLLESPPADEFGGEMVPDAKWIRQAFIVPVNDKSSVPDMEDTDIKNRRFSSASF